MTQFDYDCEMQASAEAARAEREEGREFWLAIVGSTGLGGNAQAERIICERLDYYRPTAVVSGGAKGIDTMAANAARRRGIRVIEHLPAVPEWERGYKPRNLKIAEDADILIRIALRGSKTYGSGWTRDRAKEMGKPTEEYVIDAPPTASPAMTSLTPDPTRPA